MEELIDRFRTEGFTDEQVRESLLTVTNWLEEHYPFAGTLVSSWMKSEAAPSS